MNAVEGKGRLVKVYRTMRRTDLYLYVDHMEDLTRVPEELLARFGEPVPALSVNLMPDRKLARADALDVLAAIEEQGYFLQLPPQDGGVDAAIIRAGSAEADE